jgi:3-hydroxybutyryl-CoA dehydratase
MSGYGEKRYEEFRVGDAATFGKTIGEADFLLFAAVSGDQYPLHVDAEYARGTRFGQRVAHGMLSASLLSAAIGLLLQRPGGINLEQRIRYRAPVALGDTLSARVEVVELLPERRRLRCSATVTNQRGETVIEGEALLQKDER